MNILIIKIAKFLGKNWKNAALIALAIFCFFSVRSCSDNKRDKEALESSVGILQAQVVSYKGKNGELVSQVKTHELTIDQLKDFGSKAGFKISALEDQVGKLKRLVGYWHVKASAKDTFSVHEIDTVYIADNKPIKAKAFHYSNDYLTLDQLYHPDDGKLSTSYDYKIEFELTPYRKGANLFRAGTLVTDVRFKDQNVSVKEIKGLVIQEEPKKFHQTGLFKFLVGVGLGGAGVGYLVLK